MRKRISILAICLVAGACASPAPSGSMPTPRAGSPSPAQSSGPSSTPKYAVEIGPDKLILRIADEGGFVPAGYQLTRLPEFALCGDGSVIVAGPLDATYPRLLLPDLRLLHVSPAEIQSILAAADEAGLLGPDASYDVGGVADAGTSVFTTTVAGVTHVVSAYALGLSEDLGTPQDVAAARSKLEAFQKQMLDLSTFLGRPVDGAEAYQPTVMRVFTTPAQTPNSAGPSARFVAWPIGIDPASGMKTAIEGVLCIAVTGADLTAFTAAARNADVVTVWTAPSGRYTISVRPLYPDESGC